MPGGTGTSPTPFPGMPLFGWPRPVGRDAGISSLVFFNPDIFMMAFQVQVKGNTRGALMV